MESVFSWFKGVSVSSGSVEFCVDSFSSSLGVKFFVELGDYTGEIE